MSDLLALDTAGWYLLVMIKLFFFLTYIRVISAVSVGVWCQSSRIPCEQSIEVNTVVTTLTHLISNQIEETLIIKIKSCFLLTEHDYSHINTFNIWHIKSRTIPMFEFHFDQSNILRHYLYFCFSFVYFLHKWSKIRSRWSWMVSATWLHISTVRPLLCVTLLLCLSLSLSPTSPISCLNHLVLICCFLQWNTNMIPKETTVLDWGTRERSRGCFRLYAHFPGNEHENAAFQITSLLRPCYPWLAMWLLRDIMKTTE